MTTRLCRVLLATGLLAAPAWADEVTTSVEGGRVHITIVGADDMSAPGRALVGGDAVAVSRAEHAAKIATEPEAVDSPYLDGADILDRARGGDLDEGGAPWRAVLSYDAVRGQAVWTVTNTLVGGPGRSSGDRLVFDARDGSLLERDEWSVSIDLVG